MDDEQINKALEATKVDATQKGRIKDPTKIDKPSPIHIKKVRADNQGLLLIYLLNPQPDKNHGPLSEIPFVGLALSFPVIDKDVKIEYAVNEQFLKEQLDYPEELDDEEIDEPLQTVEQENEQEKLELLQSKIEQRFNEIDRENWKPTFLKGTNVSPITLSRSGVIPYIKAKDIYRYYINPHTGLWVQNADSIIINKGLVISPVKYQKQNFSITDQQIVLNDECLAVWIPGIPSEYLLAILNSAFFAYYNIDKKGGETTKIVRKFPFIYSEDATQGISTIVKCILLLQKNSHQETAK